MFQFLQNLVASESKRPSRNTASPCRARRVTPGIEALEDRLTPSISKIGNLVHITGTAIADKVQVKIDNNNTASIADDKVVVVLTSGNVTQTKSFSLSQVKQIKCSLYNGDDTFTNNTPIKCAVFGGSGNDNLFGGSGNDQLYGGSGNDQLYGGNGWDMIWGDTGDDYLDGGYDGVGDYLRGGSGADTFVAHWTWFQNSDIADHESDNTDHDSGAGDSFQSKQH